MTCPFTIGGLRHANNPRMHSVLSRFVRWLTAAGPGSRTVEPNPTNEKEDAREGFEIDLFVGIEMAKTDHSGQGITAAGSEVIARSVVNDQMAIEQLLDHAAHHGDQVAVVIDMTASAAQLLLTVAAERRVGWCM